MSLPAGARLVRWLARVAALTYPPAFRREHGAGFPEVALHRWRTEARRRSPLRATAVSTRLLVLDTMGNSTARWMEAATDDNESAANLRAVLRSAGRWFRDGGRDLGLAARTVARRPAAALLVIITLGLGIGASTAAFDAVDRALWHPLPFAGGHRLVFLSMRDPARDVRYMPTADQFNRWKSGAKSIDRVEVYEEQSVTRVESDGATVLNGLAVTAGLPAMLEIPPVVGRMFNDRDAASDAPATIMLSEPYWRREFGADRSVVDRSLTLSTGPATIIGVWPGGARLNPREVADVFVVIPADRPISPSRFSYLLTRLASGVTRAEAERELASLMLPRAPDRSPEAPALDTQAWMFNGATFIVGVWLVFGGSLALLIVAIANSAVLLLDRSAQRGRELGVRLALGGSGLRLVRLFLAEGLVYAAAGSVVGFVVAIGMETAVTRYEPRLFSQISGAGLMGRALWFACGTAALVAIVCTLAPVYRLRSTDVREVLASAGARSTIPRRRLQRGLVAAQTTIAMLLLCGAGLMARSFANITRVDTGIDIDRLAEFSVAPPTSRYASPELKKAYIASVADALVSMPGVTGITYAGMPLLTASTQNGEPYFEGEHQPERAANDVTILTGAPDNYFNVMGIRLVAGRIFDPAERNVAIINESLARSRGGDVIGRRIFTPAGKTPMTVVGVVNDTRTYGLSTDRNQYQIYTPHIWKETFARFILRTNGDPAAILRDARLRLATIDSAVPMRNAQTGPDVFRRQTAQHRFVVVLLSGVAALGLLLALSGIYGTVALSVSHRAREMGIRLALGGTPARLRHAFIRAELMTVAIGSMLGVLAAWLAAPYLDVLLFNVTPHDPVSATAAAIAVLTTAVVAAVIPARRLSRIDPALTLRMQ